MRSRFLNRNVRITLRNEPRSFRGYLVCVDREGNAILNEVVERRIDAKTSKEIENSERFVPMIMIPGRWISRFEVHLDPTDDATSQQQTQKQYLSSSMYL